MNHYCENVLDIDYNGSMLHQIQPYFDGFVWLFTHEEMRILQEPLVSGMPEIIDEVCWHIPSYRSGFRLVFSDQEYPGWNHKLEFLRSESPDEGKWYRLAASELEGLVRPALLGFFSVPPKEIYFHVEGL